MQWTADSPGRLDAFIASKDAGTSRAQAQKMIKAGKIRVNNRTIRKSARAIRPGDCITVRESPAVKDLTPVTSVSKDLNLPVLYEDDHCLIINKPAGIAVHPAPGLKPGESTILDGIKHLFETRKIPFFEQGILVHRLDKDTTGCLLIAKTPQAHHQLQQQFEKRTVKKTYLAIVFGVPDPPAATIDAPIGRNLTDRTKMSILRTSFSKSATTTYETIASSSDCAVLRCDLHTGRTHQIRVHLRSVQHPILGDSTYGTNESATVSRKYGITGLCLHARSLQFSRLPSGKSATILADLPIQFKTALQNAGLSSQEIIHS